MKAAASGMSHLRARDERPGQCTSERQGKVIHGWARHCLCDAPASPGDRVSARAPRSSPAVVSSATGTAAARAGERRRLCLRRGRARSPAPADCSALSPRSPQCSFGRRGVALFSVGIPGWEVGGSRRDPSSRFKSDAVGLGDLLEASCPSQDCWTSPAGASVGHGVAVTRTAAGGRPPREATSRAAEFRVDLGVAGQWITIFVGFVVPSGT